MKTVAVIAEYNPFHKGHAYQLQKIKETFGEDVAIVAIMSGNFVQRGTPAILGKFDRARMAIDCGVSLVLELPFPFSSASAEYFAFAGVSVANDLGIVDALSFGSECGDTGVLTLAAEKMQTEDFNAALRARLTDPKEKAKGYPRVLSEVLFEQCGNEAAASLFLPNNILAVSYVSALQKLASSITPHTVLRHGTDEDKETEGSFAGATYLRSLLYCGQTEEALTHIPPEAHAVWQSAMASGKAPVSEDALSSLLLAHLRIDPLPARMPADCGGGVLRLLKNASRDAQSLSELYANAATKKYTAARLRRATLFSYFGVTPADIKEKPLYTQVLAMDDKGQRILADIRKSAKISLLTKPADLHKLSPAARAQAELSYRADSVYTLLLPTPQKASIFLRTAPYRK